MTPIAALIMVGMMMQKIFALDIKTLSKILLYLFLPSVLFVMAYESSISSKTLFEVLLFLGIFYGVMLFIVEIYVRIRRHGAGMRGAVRNSVILDNNGNYGIPLNQLVFMNDPFALSLQIIVMITQTFLLSTFGLFNVTGHLKLRQFLKTIASFPSIYCLIIAFTLNHLDVDIPMVVFTPIHYLADGFIAVALITLGVQLGSMKWNLGNWDAIISNFLKLCVAPIIGFLIILIMGIEGISAQVLFLTCTVPTSLSGVLLAVEFESEQNFASQTAFSSTIFSIVTVTFWLYVMPRF